MARFIRPPKPKFRHHWWRPLSKIQPPRPWVPSDLSVAPKVILDGATVAWSGSNFGTTANAGTLGGSIVAANGTVVKGTAVNGFDTLNFAGAQTLQITTRTWTGGDNFCLFAVGTFNQSLCLYAHQWSQAASGFFIAPRINTTGSVSGDAFALDDTIANVSGFNETVNTLASGMGAASRLFFAKAGTETIARVDGTAVTAAARSDTGSVPAIVSSPITFGGSAFVGEYFNGQIAYLAVLVDPSTDEIDQLEGWAAWKYGFEANLPGGHPYSAGPPMVGGSGGTEFIVPQGDTSLSTFAPSVVKTAHVVINVLQDDAVLSTVAPSVVNSNNLVVNVPQGNVALSSVAPSVVKTSHVDVNISQGNIVLSSVAPSVSVSLNRDISPAHGNLALSSTAPTRVTDFIINTLQGNLALSPTAPNAIQLLVRLPLQGNLVLSPTAPSVARTEHRDINPAQANLALSSTVPAVARTAHVSVNPPQSNVLLSANAPEVQAGAGISKSPSQGDLVLSPTAPGVAQTLHRNINIPQGNFVLSGTAPSVNIAISILPASRDLILSPTAPSAVSTANQFANPLQGNVALSSTAPSIGKSIPQGNILLSGTAPSVTIAIATFPAARDLVLSPTAPTVARTANQFANPSQSNVVLSGTSPSKVIDWSKLPASHDLVLSPTAPTVVRTAHRDISVPQTNVVLTAEAPSIGGTMSRLPPQGNVVLSATAPNVVRTAHHVISPPTRDLALSPTSPTFFASDLHPITVLQGELVLSTLPAQLIPGSFVYPLANDLLLTTTSPIIIRDRLHHWKRVISLQGNADVKEDITGSVMSVTGLQGSVNNNVSIEGG